MSEGVTTNDEQRLFVIPAGKGFSCLGFDVCYRESRQLAERLGRQDLMPREDEVGSLKQYDGYRELVKSIGSRDLGTWFSAETPEPVRRILENARLGRTRLRITLGDRETGEAWGGRPETGTIGRSMGPLKMPLLIKTSRSTGGGAILTDCIVRIEDGSRDLYRHPDFHMPEPAAAPAP